MKLNGANPMRKYVATNDPAENTSELEGDSLWLQLGVDLSSRRIHVDMEVSETMATIVIRSLLKMSENSNKPISIHLSTYGGEAYSCLAIYDAIQACPCPITIYASGKIMSAGFIIFLAANKRVAAPNTTFMIHSISSGTEGRIKDQEIDVAEGKRLNAVMLNIVATRTKMNLKWWTRQIAIHDRYMDVTQAKEYGIIRDVEVKKPTKPKTAKKVVK